ncbi:MAG: prephenate dehydrogenase/arogenate dehydrogenase family protein [Chloroflexi bacterium]|nr:prephenate dehydrogenase/arogenate dehydrogenase family protein [Chloroflexota bacterium]
MIEDGFFRRKTIAIVGLGLMGGSLALALRLHVGALLAVDPDPETRRYALERRLVNKASADPAEILPQADLIILAAPVRVNLQLLAQLPTLCPTSSAVIDLSSTKAEIVAEMNRLPERFFALGGHPMCGKETSGLPHAEAKLFKNAVFALTPTERTTPALRELAEQMISLIGSRPLWLDAQTHDNWVAATSHLPYLLSAALSSSAPPEAAPLASSGFRSATRLAASDVDMMLDILLTNRAPLISALQNFRLALTELETTLAATNERALREQLTHARGSRKKLLSD